MTPLLPLYILENSCVQNNRAKAKWSLQRTDKRIQDRLFSVMGVENIDGACSNLRLLLDGVSKIVNETLFQLPQEKQHIINQHIHTLANSASTDPHEAETHASNDIRLLTTALYTEKVFQDAITCTSLENNQDFITSLAEINDDEDIFKTLVSYDGKILQFASSTLQNNPDIVLAAISQDLRALQYASPELKRNPEFILKVLDHSASQDILFYVDESIKMNRAIGLKAVARNGMSLLHLSATLRNDPEIAKTAITNSSLAYRYAPDSIKENADIAIIAIRDDPRAYLAAPTRIQENIDIAKLAISKDGSIFSKIPQQFKSNRDIVISAVGNSASAFPEIDQTFRDDDEIAFLALKNSGAYIRFTSKRLQNDINFLLGIVHANSKTLIALAKNISKDTRNTLFQILLDERFINIKTDYPEISKQLMQDLTAYKDEELKAYLIDKVYQMDDRDIRNCFASQIFTPAQKQEVGTLLMMLYSIEFPDKEQLEKAFKNHYKRTFKDNLKQKPLLELLKNLDLLVKNKNKYPFLLKILKSENKESISHIIFLLNTIISINKYDLLTENNLNIRDLSVLIVSNFQENGFIPPGEDNAQRIMEVFSHFRNPGAFFIYASNFLFNAQMKKSLYIFTESLLDKTFFDKRHEANSHKAFLNPKQKILWETALSPQRIEEDQITPSFDVKEFLIRKLVRDNHGGSFLQRVASYLQDGVLIDRPNELEEKIIDLLTPQGNLQNKLELLAFFLNSEEYTHLEFKNDLPAAIQQLQNSSPAFGILVDSEDPEDLLVCGTEVPGSCQRIDGTDLNRCLMGYVLDGKIRLLAVKNAQGIILARSILKILVRYNNAPCLFFEEVYGDKKFTKALKKFAIAKANAMHLEVFICSSTSTGIFLYSRGNCTPYEYADAAKGVTDGTYTVCAEGLL